MMLYRKRWIAAIIVCAVVLAACSDSSGTSPDGGADTGPTGLDNPTQFVRIADNIFGSSGSWPVAIRVGRF
ncbi:MAG: hypothetical protein GY854_20860 [Deltaproteobacteria bacterium]|nr:hypothetical protein [Deltaproteobacteria bacterium]